MANEIPPIQDPPLKRYVKRANQAITAIQISLDVQDFSYQKWGSLQHGKRGDWLVENDGDVYTVSADSFITTYKAIGPGRYIKTTQVWAEIATHDGVIKTQEGESHYGVGDYLVYNRENREDGYAMAGDVFEKMYEPVSDP